MDGEIITVAIIIAFIAMIVVGAKLFPVRETRGGESWTICDYGEGRDV